jgi:hypothetical protein
MRVFHHHLSPSNSVRLARLSRPCCLLSLIRLICDRWLFAVVFETPKVLNPWHIVLFLHVVFDTNSLSLQARLHTQLVVGKTSNASDITVHDLKSALSFANRIVLE